MKKKCLLSLCLAIMLLLGSVTAMAEKTDDLAEWTVMLYLCGTDLETANMAATVNLGEIVDTTTNKNVNFVFQTGGTETWHTLEVFDELEIKSDRLQRFSYADECFRLMDEQPLANMASAETLESFIQWAAEAMPAKKYALVLWDHGGGSYSGIIQDQLHDYAIMQVEDVARALRGSGVSFETIVTDACLMATLEVAQAFAPYANYLVASEEIVPGEGGPYTQWLQYLYDHPTCDGAELGKAYGDAMMEKYTGISETTLATLTYSTIDLRKIDAVSSAFDKMFAEIGTLLDDPQLFSDFSYDIQHTQTYDEGTLYDLVDMANRAAKGPLSKETADAVTAAVQEAVVSEVHGNAQLGAHGLSFYYAPQDEGTRLDHYARNCKSASYLSFLDRVSMKWTAPEWVYDQVQRQSDISRADYSVVFEAGFDSDSAFPTLHITNAPKAVVSVDAQLMQYDEEQEEYVALGMDVNVPGSFDEGYFHYEFPGEWLAVNGTICQLSIKEELDDMTLYRIPFIVENELEALVKDNLQYEFRVGYVYSTDAEALAADPNMPIYGTYTLYGVWNQNDSSTDLPSRDVWDVSDFANMQLCLLRRFVNVYTGSATGNSVEEGFSYPEAPGLSIEMLPAGTYAMAFVVTDVFGNVQRSEPFEIQWDVANKRVTYDMLD
ncbi:MAG: clostripain-related cysteine peptidase [Eubacteriales bacterium]|nr:clostripain-related cysteine peptidase [Eubacteriales bacterium]